MLQERLRGSNSISGIIIHDVFVCLCVCVCSESNSSEAGKSACGRVTFPKDESHGSPAFCHKAPGFVAELICLALPSTADRAEQGRDVLNLKRMKKNMTLAVVFTRPERHVRGRPSRLHGATVVVSK